MNDYFYEIDRPNRQPEPANFFFVNAFLKSRIALGLESNKPYFDEDVNVYLGGLLTGLIRDDRNLARFANLRDTEVAAICEGQGARSRFDTLRSTADAIILWHALFRVTTSGGRPPRFFDESMAARIGRARMYYQAAADIGERLPGHPSSLAEILAKLALDLDKYVFILRHAGTEHLALRRRMTPGELYHLWRDVDVFARREEIPDMRDRFLDLYGRYLQDSAPTSDMLEEINDLIGELSLIDPQFEFAPIQ